jgi:dTDP-4-dehydrorhamnose 3,5-epimerase
MIFEPLSVAGAYLIKPEPREDHRGFFARMFDEKIWKEQGLSTMINQCNASLTKKKGSLRGLHYQNPPYEEVKLVRCTRGSMFDVVADKRKDSPTYGKWAGVELSADNHAMMYVPAGCVHGFQSLTDDCEVFYMVSAPYNKEAEGGVRYDDPTFNIAWPLPISDISERDMTHPFLQ